MRLTHNTKTALAYLLFATFAFTGCVDGMLDPTQELMYDENLVEASLSVSVTEFDVSTTRSEDPSDTPEEISVREKHIDNIWIFQYNASTNTLSTAPIYKTIDDQDELDNLKVNLNEVSSYIYVVANTNSDSWAEDAAQFNTPELLLAQEIPTPFPVIYETAEERGIPMEGVTANAVIPGGTTVTVPVTRMYAKVKVNVHCNPELVENTGAVVSSVALRNIPWYCRVGTLYDADKMSEAAEYPDDTWITRTINDKNGESADDYDYVFYIPENISGEVTDYASYGEDCTKADYAPVNALSIVVRLDYKEEETGASMYKYFTACPGGNDYNNYNVRRNCVYRVTMEINYPITFQYQPSANCIYAAPGSTVFFEPYYREETGGGYDFSNYLNPETTGKRIKTVRILWQTEDCIGDNSDGSKVYFEPEVTGEDQTLHSRIYVTVKNPGNAVIAAYDDDPDINSSANIIWSWHIWVPNTDVPDPTNEVNGKLFYTYDWDENRIYSYRTNDKNGGESGVETVETGYTRIPGRTIMDLNLGALEAKPSGNVETSTYGLIYEWGRKDPFPSLKTRGSNTGEDDFPHITKIQYASGDSYDETVTEPLYKNDGTRISGMTVFEDESKLFHSVSGKTINAQDYGIEYTIANPTVYMCGTEQAGGQNSLGSYTSNKSVYTFAGAWNSEDPDNLWGTIPLAEAKKSLKVGTDSIGDRYLYDDYGEKSIFDPCPYGWRVPPSDLWLGLTATGGEVNGNAHEESGYDDINCESVQPNGFWFYLTDWKSGQTTFFPDQGARLPDGCGVARICGTYHNASPDTEHRTNTLHVHSRVVYGTEDLYSSFFVKIFEMGDLFYYMRSCGGAVRCCREEK